MNREEAIKEWIIPALKNTWNEKKNAEILKALEQEPCEDAISRELVKKDIARWIGYIDEDMIARMHISIDKLPPVTPRQKTGYWIDTGSGQECSNCHEIQCGYDNHRLYCANCGSRNMSNTTTALQGRT